MKISDEIRIWCDRKCGGYIDGDVRDDLYALADRIDNGMVELPKDADGVPIHVGDTVYLDSVSKADVKSIEFSQGEHSIVFTVRGKGFLLSPQYLSHERPDSLECIADDIEAAEGWCDMEGEYGTGITSVEELTLREWAERIRKMAKKEGE